ncbi:PREDICTED: UDP-glucuronosyltransferase 2B30-like [Dinoponera quadriceps]|uniref:UDP-glucuronosyltransferase n=1 Tax=Dinoponera quadriceps TaxID=609295 RepID=A0A6P3XN37_DINQU|nr:PREDICTED: UDP-glucuronosyltransferase 2B30-like [Dinoponera quadriceps]
MKVLSVLLAILVTCDQSANGFRILGVFPLHGHSHWVMNEPLMKGLAQRGHQVDVITHFPQKKPVPNYTDISLFGSLPNVRNNISATEIQAFGGLSMKHLTEIAGNNICELLAHPKIQDLIKNPPQDPPYDLVIVEVFMAPCFLAFGRHLKVPLVATVTCSFHDWLNELSGNSFNPSYVPSLFSSFGQHMNFKERMLNFLTSHLISAQILYHTEFQAEYLKKYFDMQDTAIMDLYSDISLYLVNSHYSLSGIRPLTPAIVEVGGLHVKSDNVSLAPEVQKWLDESKDGCVYFTFGSMVRIETFSKELMEEFYASFKKIAPVRVLMKVAKKEDLLPGLPDNVMTQSWFPQIAVLKHKNIRAFITHGGLMGTQEAIYYGVPMIGIPLFGDQKINIQSYERKKIAISLNSVQDVTEEKLTSALNSILKDPTYRENVQYFSKLFVDRPLSPLDTAIFWVEYIKKYGNFLQSPAMQLYWWQRHLLDVYAFLLLIVIVVLLVVMFILRKLKRLLFGSHVCTKKDSAAIKAKKNK